MMWVRCFPSTPPSQRPSTSTLFSISTSAGSHSFSLSSSLVSPCISWSPPSATLQRSIVTLRFTCFKVWFPTTRGMMAPAGRDSSTRRRIQENSTPHGNDHLRPSSRAEFRPTGCWTENWTAAGFLLSRKSPDAPSHVSDGRAVSRARLSLDGSLASLDTIEVTGVFMFGSVHVCRVTWPSQRTPYSVFFPLGTIHTIYNIQYTRYFYIIMKQYLLITMNVNNKILVQ